ncbi:hypothetical protein JCM3774_003669 [Rhodotorula dairenensis]
MSGCGQPEQEQDGPIAPAPETLARCARCSQPAVLAARGTASCRDCFVLSFTNRFTKALQPARSAAGNLVHYQRNALAPRDHQPRPTPPPTPTKSKTRLVVACSGGPASTALVHLVHQTLFAAHNTGKGRGHRYSQFLPFSGCEVVHVDHSAVPGYGPDRTDQVRQLVTSIAPDFTFTALRLEDAFRLGTSSLNVSARSADLPSIASPSSLSEDESSSSSISGARERLVALLSPDRFSPTALASLQRSLLDSLLTAHAASGSSSSSADTVLLLGDTGTRSAIRTLAGMSQGRGYSIGEEVALEQILDATPKGAAVMVLRPLGQAVDKEVAFYNRECARIPSVMLDPLETETAGSGSGAAAAAVEVSAKTRSIPGLVQDFILKLDADFPSTVPTVVRTAHKLGLRSSHAAFVNLSSSPPSSASSSSSSADAGAGAAACCPLCGLPAQPRADEWRKAITISDLQAALAADSQQPSSSSASASGIKPPGMTTLEERTSRGGRGAVTITTSTTTTKRREPYQPSQAHLLVDGVDDGGAAAAADPPSDPVSVNGRDPRPPPAEEGTDSDSDSLARYLCYGCLLVLSEPAASGNKHKHKRQNRKKGLASAPASVEKEEEEEVIVLPGYVADAVERRRRARRRGGGEEGGGRGVVGTKEVRGDEAMRREVERYLL